jgi:hypothetical protein
LSNAIWNCQSIGLTLFYIIVLLLVFSPTYLVNFAIRAFYLLKSKRRIHIINIFSVQISDKTKRRFKRSFDSELLQFEVNYAFRFLAITKQFSLKHQYFWQLLCQFVIGIYKTSEEIILPSCQFLLNRCPKHVSLRVLAMHLIQIDVSLSERNCFETQFYCMCMFFLEKSTVV